MAKTTKIQWCDSTLNLLVGCSGCELYPDQCYAAELVGRYAGQKGWPQKFTEPCLYLERLPEALAWQDLTGTDRPDKPWLNGRPRMIFVNDLGDTFSPAVSAGQLQALEPAIVDMGRSPHRWLMLTKWPLRMAEFVAKWQRRFEMRWPNNIWMGVSATSQQTFDARVHDLVHHVRQPNGMPVDSVRHLFVSIEPMLEPISIAPNGLAWVIVGGESGRNARPCVVEWVDDIRRQCKATGIQCFVKQLGSNPVTSNANMWDDLRLGEPWQESFSGCHLRFDDSKGGDWDEWPPELRVRQVPYTAD